MDGTAERDYIHVEDVATAHLQCLNYLSENSGFKAINLATGVSTSILKLLKMFEKVSGEKIPFVFSPRRLGDFDKVWADPALAFLVALQITVLLALAMEWGWNLVVMATKVEAARAVAREARVVAKVAG